MAVSTKTGYDPSTMQWVEIDAAEARQDPIPGEDEYLQIMVRQMQEKLAKMKPRGSTAAAQPPARKTGSTLAACAESPTQLASWRPTHTPRIRRNTDSKRKQGGPPTPPTTGAKAQPKQNKPKPSNVPAGQKSKPPTFQAGDFPSLSSPHKQ
ncbi:hypothetical protein MTO96_032050, partial [Rhipicephalus appendiculatus]